MLVDHLIQYRFSPWPKTAEKRVFCVPTDGLTDGPTDGRTNRRTDGWTERASYRVAFLTEASKNKQTHENVQTSYLMYKQSYENP